MAALGVMACRHRRKNGHREELVELGGNLRRGAAIEPIDARRVGDDRRAPEILERIAPLTAGLRIDVLIVVSRRRVVVAGVPAVLTFDTTEIEPSPKA